MIFFVQQCQNIQYFFTKVGTDFMTKFARVASINKRASTNPLEFIKMAEDNYTAYTEEAAQIIADSHKCRPIVLLSGPSGSGKTTTALRIERCLKNMGINVSTISMDNYFLPITPESELELPRDENGNIDLESPHRLDIPLFSEHLKKLADGEEILMPHFDFKTQSRSDTTAFKREKDQVLIIEGIHALNPLVTGNTGEFATCIYVSVRTRLKSADGDLLHPRQIRLMRRLCRDRLFRKRSLADIFRMFKSVSRGEDLYITPFKNRADYEIDTFMAYEASVYKHFLETDLISGADDEELTSYVCYDEIIKFLAELETISSNHVPSASLIREFIGGSELAY